MLPSFFYKLPNTVLRCFRGYFLLWQLVAIILTAIIVLSGFDWWYFTFFNNSTIQRIFFSAAPVGFFVPIFSPFIVWIIAKIQKNSRLFNTAGAIGQAAGLGLIISSLYKAFTGRIPPELFQQTASLTDISHQFQFGFLRGGVFWGWPSSHTTVAFAVAFTLYTLYPDKKFIRYLALGYALYIGFGISMSIHWFSEFIAGAIIGSVIGINVGKSFLEKK